MSHKLYKKIISFIIMVMIGAAPLVGFAQTTGGTGTGGQGSSSSSSSPGIGSVSSNLTNFGNTAYGKTNTSPLLVAAKIINYGTGVLGILLVIYLIYGGVMWMTAAGESGKVDKAKDILRSAIIGLIITLSAFGISTFVVNAIEASLK